MSSGRRYDRSRRKKLNMKKVFGVIIAIAVVIMSVISIGKLLSADTKKEQETNKEFYYTAYKDGKWGVINQKGNDVLPLNHEEMVIVPDNTKDIFIVMTSVDYEAGTYKTIAQNAKGEKLFADYETVEAIDNFDETGNVWYEQCLKVQKEGKYGLINFKGEQLLECKYDNIKSLKGVTNSLIIEKDGKVGIASNVGDVIAEAKYTSVQALTSKYSDGYIVTTEEGKSGIISSNKKTILEPIYEEIKHVASSDLYVAKQDGTLKVIDTDGNTVINGGYDDFVQIHGETIIAKKR